MNNKMSCLVCGSAMVKIHLDGPELDLAPSALGSSRVDVSPGRILRCCVCRFGFRQIRPDSDVLSQLYHDLDSKVYQSERHGRTNTADRHLQIVNRFQTPGRLLDVGAASGEFLRRAADGGWSVIGIEPALTLCEKAKALLGNRGDVLHTTLEGANVPEAVFDAVTLWDVLEHVPDPVSFMGACGRLVRPGGCLYVNVPDLDSPQARILGRRWPALLPEHLNYFNRASLRHCGQRAGLTWVTFGHRPASFTTGYVMYRLAQHGVPGAALGHRLIRNSRLGSSVIPTPIGEVYGVWARPAPVMNGGLSPVPRCQPAET